MFPKNLFALCVLATVLVASVSAENGPKLQVGSLDFLDDFEITLSGYTVEQRNKILDAIIEFLEDALVGATKNCLKEAANHCKKHFLQPKKLLECAKEYFRENGAECAIPEYRNIITDLSDEEIDEIQARNPLLQAAIRIIAKAFVWAAKHCVAEAANHCKSYWNHPGQLVNCAKNYLAANKGRCVLG